jgi:serine protease DegS
MSACGCDGDLLPQNYQPHVEIEHAFNDLSAEMLCLAARLLGQEVTHGGRPYLGVQGIREVTPFVAAQYGLGVENGVLIGGIAPNGPAARAGLRAGDVIVRLGSHPTLSEAAFGDALARLRPGQRVRVTVARQNGERTVTVTLGELPVEQ